MKEPFYEQVTSRTCNQHVKPFCQNPKYFQSFLFTFNECNLLKIIYLFLKLKYYSREPSKKDYHFPDPDDFKD